MRSAVLVLILIAATHARAGATPQELVDLDVQLQLQTAGTAAGREPEQARDLLARFAQVAREADAEAHRAPRLPPAKLRALEGLRHNLQRALDHPSGALAAFSTSAHALHGPTIELEEGAPGTGCTNAIPVEIASALRVSMPAGSTRWFTVRGDSPAGQVAVSTRGSTIDAAVRVWSDCREVAKTPLVEVDDSYGLQAIAPLPRATHPLVVEVRNLGGEGVAAIEAINSVTIRGRVTRESSGAALPGVRIYAFQGSSPFQASYWGETSAGLDGTYVLTTFSGNTGPFNTYVRTAQSTSPPLALDEAWNDVPCPNSSFGISGCGPGTLTSVASMDGASVTGIDFALRSGGVVFGQVRSRTGDPVRFAEVRVDVSGGGNPQYFYRSTDDQGRYRITGLPTGTARVQASSSEHRSQVFRGFDCPTDCASIAGTPLTLAEAVESRADFDLIRLGSIEVQLTVDGGAVSSNSFIALSAINSVGVVVDQSFASGSSPVVLGPLPAGTYRVLATGTGLFSQLYAEVVCAQEACQPADFAAATLVPVSENAVPVAISMNLRRLPSVAGRVTDEVSGLPIAGARVALARGFSRTEVFTGATGVYALQPPGPGNYLVYARSDRHQDELHPDVRCEEQSDLSLCPGAELVVVGAAPIAPVDFALLPSAEILGQVTSLNPSFFQVRAVSTANQALSGGKLTIGAQGSYALRDLMPRTYRFGVDGSSVRLQLFDNIDCGASAFDFSSCPATGPTHVPLVSGQSRAGIDFGIRSRNGRFGRVVDAQTGAPLRGVAIDVWTLSGQRAFSATSAIDGRFELVNSFSGSSTNYYVATDNYLGYRNQVYDGIQCAQGSVYLGTCSLTGGTPITIPGNDTEIVFALVDIDPIFRDGFD